MKEVKFRGKRVDNGAWVYGVPYAEYMICGTAEKATTPLQQDRRPHPAPLNSTGDTTCTKPLSKTGDTNFIKPIPATDGGYYIKTISKTGDVNYIKVFLKQ